MNQLIENNFKEITRVAHIIAGNSNDASALIADTYLVVIDKDYQEQGKFVQWFSKSMKNLFLTQKRKKLLEVQLPNVLKSEQSLSLSRHLELSDYVDKRLAEVNKLKISLKPWEQELFDLIIDQGMTYKEVAKQLKHMDFECSHRSIEKLFKPVREKIKLLRYD